MMIKSLIFWRQFHIISELRTQINQAERDVRHAKVKIKVSGCFRSLEGAKEFAKINSVLSTARKHGIVVIDTIMATLAQASCIPWALASE